MSNRGKKEGFSLLEMMAVVIIILCLLGLTAITFSRAQPGTQIKTDAANTISFLRNMWDLVKAGGSSLVLQPDYESGRFFYIDPRTGVQSEAEFTSDAVVIGVRINDRIYNQGSFTPPGDNEEEYGDSLEGVNNLYLSEGRGLTRVGLIFAIPEKDQLTHITMASLNLITGKGKIKSMDEEELQQLIMMSQEAAAYEDY